LEHVSIFLYSEYVSSILESRPRQRIVSLHPRRVHPSGKSLTPFANPNDGWPYLVNGGAKFDRNRRQTSLNQGGQVGQ
jgi:hypothetical protein